MKRNFIICLLHTIILGWANICMAQPKYSAAYKQSKDETFNALFKDIADNGWLYFKDEQPAQISPDEFLKKYASAIPENRIEK